MMVLLKFRRHWYTQKRPNKADLVADRCCSLAAMEISMNVRLETKL
jgi:hypothetical protein